MVKFGIKFSAILALASVVFVCGAAFGLSALTGGWLLRINGQPSQVPVHIIKNMYFVSLADLAKLPGWKVNVDLGSRNISLTIPALSKAKSAGIAPAEAKKESRAQAAPVSSRPMVSSGIEVEEDSGGPPNNVRMTVKAALTSLDELRKALAEGASADALKQKRDSTAGIVQQAENLLWSLPRTRTLQADLQVALEDLQSQVNLALALDQAKDGLLPWTHPTAQNLLMKYPDLHPCRITKGSTDGLDVACARKMMGDVSNEDFNDVERDLDQYR